MKKYILVLATLLVVSCKGTQKELKNDVKSSFDAKYVLSKALNSINFTAFKTTEKIGVKGLFKEVEITKNGQGESIKEAINGTEFKIPITSIETNNSGRNVKIMTFFFGAMANTEFLTGKINLTDDTNGVVDFTMNNLTKKLPFTYTITSNVFSMKALMNVDHWNAQVALEKLNSACEELHTGKDGISKTWNEVAIEITSTF